MKCPKCGSTWAIEFETKYTKKGYWCDECGNEWVIPNRKFEWDQLE
tara:strand:+ start:7 stop:144 length:138 start_codon:yes stop_codon:yes gene_type:complete